MFKKFFLCLCLVSGSINANAEEDKVIINNLNYCPISPTILSDYEPEHFQPTNNLLRGSGKIASYCGEKIIISGKLVDQNCVPISDAKVYLWQTGCDGKYPYKPLKNRIDKNRLNLTKNTSSFQGNGIATTDNNGNFYFITIRPEIANIRVIHYNLGQLDTTILIKENHLIKKNDEINTALLRSADNNKIYFYQIVMAGESGRRY